MAGAGDVADVWVTVCKTVRPMLRVCCPVCSVQSVCLSVTFEHCGQTIGRMKMKLNWHAGRPQPWPHCVRWRPSPSHPQKGGRAPSPIFGLFLLWPNRLMHQDATWYGGRPQPRRLCVRWGPSFPFPKRGRRPSPQFSAHVHCGQTAGCIKLPLGVEVGLSPGRLCDRWGRSPSSERGGAPNFQPMSIVVKRLHGSMLIGMEVGVGLQDIVLDGDPASLPKGVQPPIFGHCLLWPNGWMD